MKIKKIICLILCLTTLAVMLSGCQNQHPIPTESNSPTPEPSEALTPSQTSTETPPIETPPTETPPIETPPVDKPPTEIPPVDETTPKGRELALAIKLDFPVESLNKSTISSAEYSEILDRLIEYTAPDKLAEWKKLYPNFRSSNEQLDRFNAMLALYLAANHIGDGWGQVLYGDNAFIHSLNHNWDKDYIDWQIFEGLNSYGYNVDEQIRYVDSSAYHYTLTRKSPISGEFLFSYDKESNSLRVEDDCTYEEALLAAIRLICSQDPNVCENEPVFTATEQTEIDKAAELGFSTENITDLAINGAELSALLDKYIEIIAPEKLAGWKAMYPWLRSDKTPLTRQTAMVALFLAGQHIGGDYAKVTNEPGVIAMSTSREWVDISYIRFGIFGGYDSFPMFSIGAGGAATTYDITMASYYYTVGRYSPFNGEYLFSYDEATNSLLPESICTYSDALLAIVRVMCSGNIHLLKAPSADIADASIITAELLAKSQSNPIVTSENHPRWTGFNIQLQEKLGNMEATPENLNFLADEGFNSVRIVTEYWMFFKDYECTVVNQFGFSKLDKLVATAIERDLHLNIVFHHLPGRTMEHDQTTFEAVGDFDLFTSEQKQEYVLRLWKAIAKRYSGVSNFNFSITPFYEADNANLSSGLPGAEYTPEDVTSFLGKAVDTIRAISPDRLIIYEPGAATPSETILHWSPSAQELAKEKGNMIISYNFADSPFIYAFMTADEGRNIDDDGHSYYYVDFPVKYYVISEFINDWSPLKIDGCLPAGTKIDIYLKDSTGGQVYVTADGIEIFRESLEGKAYDVGHQMTTFVHYAQSDKKITFTLSKDTDEVKINMQNGDIRWCGIDIFLPEEYARDRWYLASRYDVFLGLEQEAGIKLKHDSRIIISPGGASEESRITVHEDLTYTTPILEAESSDNTIEAWCKFIESFDGNCVVRFERAGSFWSANEKYYDSLLNNFAKYGFSWWSCDFGAMTETATIPESPAEEYAGFKFFNKNLLKLLQKYQ